MNFKKVIITLSSLIILGWISIVLYFSISNPEIEWDWDSIDTDDIHFPNTFAWGTATAAHQVE